MSRSRRERAPRHQGSGRVTTRRPFNFTHHQQQKFSAPARRSPLGGVDEFDDVDDFFVSASSMSTPGTGLSRGSPGSSDGAATTTSSGRGRSTTRRTAAASSSKKSPASRRTPTPRGRLSYSGAVDGAGGDDGDDYDEGAGFGGMSDLGDSGRYSDDDGGGGAAEGSYGVDEDLRSGEEDDGQEEEEEEQPPAKPARRGKQRRKAKAKAFKMDTPELGGGSGGGGRAKAKKGRGRGGAAAAAAATTTTRGKRRTPTPRTFQTPDPNLLDNSVDEDVDGHLQPLPEGPVPDGVRRSKRARYKPLAHWKNERVTTSVVHAKDGSIAIKTKAQRDGVPTPVIKRGRNQGGASTPFAKRNQGKPRQAGAKKGKKGKKKKGGAGGGSGGGGDDDDDADDVEPVELPEGFEEATSATVPIVMHNEAGEAITEKIRIVRFANRLGFRALPSDDSDEPPALASGTFEREKFLAGLLKLEPQARKSRENVRKCNQVFHVTRAQPKSVEMVLNKKQRYLLSAGDEFFVPPDCDYELKNHSKSVDAVLSFVVVKPPQ